MNKVYKDFLLMATRGEKDMKQNLPFMTEKDFEGNVCWTISSHDHEIDAFGKLVNEPAVVRKGRTIQHRKYYHGFFASLRCTEDYYSKYKEHLDKYINEEEYLLNATRSTWL